MVEQDELSSVLREFAQTMVTDFPIQAGSRQSRVSPGQDEVDGVGGVAGVMS